MKQGWEIKKLGEVATYVNGYAFKPEHWGELGVPIIRIQNLNNPSAEFNYCDVDIPEKFVVEDGDILISWSASLGVYEWNRGKAYLNQHIFKVVFNKVDINKYFLKYAVNAKLNDMLKDAHGATMKHIVKGDFDNTIIPYPPREEQERIVEELDCLSGVIEKKREQLKQLDALAQSIFYQMFGDPITNEKGWEVKCLRDISTIGTGATPSREKEELYYGGEIHWVKTTEVQNCDIHSTEETITQLAVEQTNCKVYPQNTLLMAMYGQGKTRGQIARLKISAATNQACAAIMLDEARCILDFIYELLLIKYESIRAMAKGGNQANLNLKIVGSIPIILPPLALQQEFAEKIEAIEKQKELIKQSISETETLFNARMDYYFN